MARQVTETIYLHIGTEKTGTTTIQAVGGINRRRLARRTRLFYPKVPGQRSHLKLTLFSSDAPNLGLRRVAGLFSEDDFDEFRAGFATELQEEINEAECSKVLLSNEHLSAHIRYPYEAERLADILKPLAKSVKVIVYLRRQDDLYRSHYSTSVKTGRSHELDPPTREDNRYYNYALLLAPWAEMFGEKNLIVRIFDRKSLVGGDVVKDLFTTIDVPLDEKIRIPDNRNPRLDNSTLQFLLAINKHVPWALDDTLNPDRGDLARALESISDGPALAMSSDVLRRIMRLYEDSNAEVARRFLGRADGLLFPPANYAEESEPTPLTLEKAVEIGAHLWRWKQRQLNQAKQQIAELKAEERAQAEDLIE